jgi:ATPases with chaperone activity, ATP-binding subunit
MYRTALETAKRKFSPEFMNRLDKVVVFRTLSANDMRQILDIELNEVQTRIMSRKRKTSSFSGAPPKPKTFCFGKARM